MITPADAPKQKFFHYVPIQETIQRLFEDKSVEKELTADRHSNNPEIL